MGLVSKHSVWGVAAVVYGIGCSQSQAPPLSNPPVVASSSNNILDVPAPIAPMAPKRFSIIVNRPDTFFSELDKAIGESEGAAVRTLFGASALDLTGDEQVVIEAAGDAAKPTLTVQRMARDDSPPSLRISFAEPDELASIPPLFGAVLARLTKTAEALPDGKGQTFLATIEDLEVSSEMAGVRRLDISVTRSDPEHTQLLFEIQMQPGDFPLNQAIGWLGRGADKNRRTPTTTSDALLLCPEPSTYILSRPSHQEPKGSALNLIEPLLPEIMKGQRWKQPFADLAGHVTSPTIQCQSVTKDGTEIWEVVSFDDGGKAASLALKSLDKAEGVHSRGLHYTLTPSKDGLVFRTGMTKDKSNALAMRIVRGHLVSVLGGPNVIDSIKQVGKRQTPPALSSALLDGSMALVADLSAALSLARPVQISGAASATGDSLQLKVVLDEGGVWLLHLLLRPR